MGHWVWMGVGCPCPPVRNDIVTPRHLFSPDLLGVDVELDIVGSDLHPAVDELFFQVLATDPRATLGSVDEEEDTGIGEGRDFHRRLHQDHRKLRLHTLQKGR